MSDQLSPDERARTQGFDDLLIGLVSATSSLGSGIVFASVGYNLMGRVGAMAALIPITLTVWWRMGKRRLVAIRKSSRGGKTIAF